MEAVTPGVNLGCARSLIGTLGFFARFIDLEGCYAFTCSHSLAPGWSSTVALPSPGLPDQCVLHVPGSDLTDDTAVGEMIWAKTLQPAVTVDYDCAIARLNQPPISEIDGKPLNEVWSATLLPTSLLLVCGDQRISGTLVSQSRMEGQLSVPRRPDGPFDYDNLFAVTYSDSTEDGMSGSPVLGPGGELVGLHVGRFQDTSYFQRVDEILAKCRMDLYRP